MLNKFNIAFAATLLFAVLVPSTWAQDIRISIADEAVGSPPQDYHLVIIHDDLPNLIIESNIVPIEPVREEVEKLEMAFSGRKTTVLHIRAVYQNLTFRAVGFDDAIHTLDFVNGWVRALKIIGHHEPPPPCTVTVNPFPDLHLNLIPCEPDERQERFYLSTSEITNSQFLQFIQSAEPSPDSVTVGEWIATQKPRCRIRRKNGQYFVEQGYYDYPVVEVSYWGATAFCRWLSSSSSREIRLPTSVEWLISLFQQNIDVPLTNKLELEMTARDSQRVEYLIGNLWEWCSKLQESTKVGICGGSYADDLIKLSETIVRHQKSNSIHDKSQVVDALCAIQEPTTQFYLIGFRVLSPLTVPMSHVAK